MLKQYGASTKQWIDYIISVALGPQSDNPTFEQSIKQEGNISGGMYPTSVDDVDGHEIKNPIYITIEQSGETVHLIRKQPKTHPACHK